MTGDTTSKAPAASEQGSAYEELQNARMHIEILQRQLHQALEAHRASSAEIARLHTIERDRDKYRATVLSLAFQNKVLNDELSKTRKGQGGKEEQYYDAKLINADLKETLAIRDREIEELQEERGHVPTTDTALLAGYQRMRDVFESLRGTLACPLCYEVFRPNDVLTLECGHTMCTACLKNWSDRNLRLYNLTTTPDCPECRAPGRHPVKVYMLEEAVRTVDRLDRLEAQARAAKQADLKVAVEQDAEEREEVARLLIERVRLPYGSTKSMT